MLVTSLPKNKYIEKSIKIKHSLKEDVILICSSTSFPYRIEVCGVIIYIPKGVYNDLFKKLPKNSEAEIYAEYSYFINDEFIIIKHNGTDNTYELNDKYYSYFDW